MALMGLAAPAASSSRIALRFVLVIVSAVFALALFVPSAGLGWQDAGVTGFRLDTATGRLLGVIPESPAARAGLLEGDVVAARSLAPATRALLFDVGAVPPDLRLDFAIERGGVTKAVHLTTAHRTVTRSLFEKTIFCLQALEYAMFVLTGAALVLLRPGGMTWALYAYCLCTAQIHDGFRFYAGLDPALYLPFYLFGATFLTGFAPVPLLPFVTRFPNDAPSGWRRSLSAAMPAIVVACALHWALLAFAGVYLTEGRVAFEAYYRIVHVTFAAATYFAAAFVLFKTYREAHGPDRQRLQWVVFGMSFAFAAMALGYVTATLAPLPFVVTRVVNLFSIVMPLSIMYAILKHRLIDVRFVANRAAVYAVMTTLVILSLELIDWLVGTILAEEHWAKVFEGMAAVALGFASDRLYHVVRTTIEKVLFRERHRAEQHLVRVGSAFAFTDSEHSIGEGLALEAAGALSLASAAVFRPAPEGERFVRTDAVGWSDRDARELDADDALLRYLRAEEDAIAISEVHWKRADVPQAGASPVLAIPLCMRHALVGIALYGAHRNGAQLDPVEVRLLRELCDEASRAFDRADAREVLVRLERRNAELEAAVQRRLGAIDLPRTAEPSTLPT